METYWSLLNFTNGDYSNDDEEQDITWNPGSVPTILWFTAAAQGLISIIGWLANLVVIVRTLTRKTARDTHFLLYVIHLGISNLTFLTTVPFRLMEMILLQWILGQALCKIITLCTYMNFTVVALMLMLMSIDRYFAAFRTSSRFRSKKVANWACLFVWIVSLSVSLPLALMHSVKEEEMKCNPHFPSDKKFNLSDLFQNWGLEEQEHMCRFPRKAAALTVWNVCNFFCSFFIPFLVITFCYGGIIYRMCRPTLQRHGTVEKKFRRKVTLMCLMFVISYAICYTPYYIWQACKLVGIPVQQMSTCSHVKRFNTTMAYVNSAVQPLVYIVTSAHMAKPQVSSDGTNGHLLKERRRESNVT